VIFRRVIDVPSVGLDAGVANHLGPLGNVVADQLAEARDISWCGLGALLRQLLLDVGLA
jgi:hypothetical protein